MIYSRCKRFEEKKIKMQPVWPRFHRFLKILVHADQATALGFFYLHRV